MTNPVAEGRVENGTVRDTLLPHVLAILDRELSIHNILKQAIRPAVQRLSSDVTATLRGDPSYNEVGQVTSLRPDGNKILTVDYMDTTLPDVVHMDSCLVEPLCYPLLFLHGHKGWGQQDAITTFFKYLASRMLMPDIVDVDHNLMYMPAREGGTHEEPRYLPCSRFQAMSRVGQVYFVDQMSRAIDFQLDWIEKHQDSLFGTSRRPVPALMSEHGDPDGDEEEPDELDAEEQEAGGDARQPILPQAFNGSKKNLKRKALNALAILSEFGKATFFLTMTCNTQWPEITSQLLQGQTAFDRPDITSMVFKHRLQKFLAKLQKGDFYPSAFSTDYIMRAIEFQHRGLPHAHIVFRLKEAPDDESHMDDIIAFVDMMITAEFPLEPVVGSRTEAADRRYLELVSTHNMHKCLVGERGCMRASGCTCRRGYSDDGQLLNNTTFNTSGYPLYKRPAHKDRRVVPHNRSMLMAWDGHLNLEYAASVKVAMYLYKYLYKGPKKVNIDITATDRTVSEISLYLKGRFISSMDAIWRIFGYQMYPPSIPHVRIVKVKTEETLNELLTYGKTCDLAVYFNRPIALAALKYTELFSKYICGVKLPARFQGVSTSSTDYFTIHITVPGSSTVLTLYLFKRAFTKNVTITRMEMLYVYAGEIWYLRLILLNESPRSYKDALTHSRSNNGLPYNTYQEAALAKGYVTDGGEALKTFEEQVGANTSPKELRGLFCVMLIHGFPMMEVYTNIHLQDAIMADYIVSKNGNKGAARN